MTNIEIAPYVKPAAAKKPNPYVEHVAAAIAAGAPEGALPGLAITVADEKAKRAVKLLIQRAAILNDASAREQESTAVEGGGIRVQFTFHGKSKARGAADDAPDSVPESEPVADEVADKPRK